MKLNSKDLIIDSVRRALLSASVATMVAGMPMAYAEELLHTGTGSDVIATVNGKPITQAQLDDTLKFNGQSDTPATRANTTQGLIARELIRQAAEREKLGDAAPVRQAIEKARVDGENRLYVERHARPAAVTDAQVRASYDAIVGELGPQEYKARVISVPSDLAARAILAKLASGVPFETLAAQESMALSKAAGGAIPWVSFKTPVTDGHTQGLALPLAQVISSLGVGQVSANPIAVGNMSVIVKLDAKRPTAIPSYEQAQASLRQTLESQTREQAFTRLVETLSQRAVIVP